MRCRAAWILPADPLATYCSAPKPCTGEAYELQGCLADTLSKVQGQLTTLRDRFEAVSSDLRPQRVIERVYREVCRLHTHCPAAISTLPSPALPHTHLH